MLALALSLLSLGAFVTAQGLLGTPKPVCPLASGTFNELYAVAIYLANEDLMEEAELCLVDAIAASMPAFTLLSDINTVNGESPPHAPLQLCQETTRQCHTIQMTQQGGHTAGLTCVLRVRVPSQTSTRVRRGSRGSSTRWSTTQTPSSSTRRSCFRTASTQWPPAFSKLSR